MKETSTMLRCLDCDHRAPRMASCPECGGGRIVDANAKTKKRRVKVAAVVTDESVDVCLLKGKDPPRYKFNLPEVERVFGGGLVKGSKVVIAGAPGIGKSTLFLMIAGELARVHKVPEGGCSVLYVAGEEPDQAIGSRARRLDQSVPGLRVLATKLMSKVEDALRARKPKLVIIDSVATMSEEEDGSGEGTVKAIKAVVRRLGKLCEELGTTMLMSAHVTKENLMGGPKVLEHLVDAFAMFEGDRRSTIRVLQIIKNRFGPAGELAVLEMTGSGLREVADAAAHVLSERSVGEPGSVVFPSAEADRPMLSLVEAMASGAPEIDEATGNVIEKPPRLSSATGIVPSRVPRLLVLLAEVAKLQGMSIDLEATSPTGAAVAEQASDLAVAVAIASSALRIAVPHHTVAMGIVSVTGRVKAVPRCLSRLESAMAAGFTTALVPIENVNRGEIPKGMQVQAIEHVREVVAWIQLTGIVPGNSKSSSRKRELPLTAAPPVVMDS